MSLMGGGLSDIIWHIFNPDLWCCWLELDFQLVFCNAIKHLCLHHHGCRRSCLQTPVWCRQVLKSSTGLSSREGRFFASRSADVLMLSCFLVPTRSQNTLKSLISQISMLSMFGVVAVVISIWKWTAGFLLSVKWEETIRITATHWRSVKKAAEAV